MSCIDESTTPMDPCKYRVITCYNPSYSCIYFRPFIGAPHVDPSTSLGPIWLRLGQEPQKGEAWRMLAFRYPDAHELHTTLMLGQDRGKWAVDLTK